VSTTNAIPSTYAQDDYRALESGAPAMRKMLEATVDAILAALSSVDYQPTVGDAGHADVLKALGADPFQRHQVLESVN